MKKREDLFDRDLRELYDIKKMLKEEGQSDGECSYKVFMGVQLLYLVTTLHRIALVLFCLLGFVIGKFLSGSL